MRCERFLPSCVLASDLIADTADCFNIAAGLAELDAKRADVNVERAVFPFGFKAPHTVHQRRAGQDDALIPQQQAQKLKAAQALFNDTFINGDSAQDTKAFDGLEKALTGSDTEYNKAGSIDLSTSELVTKNYQYFLDMLDEFLGGHDGTPSFIAGNTKLIAKLRACARRASMYQTTMDNWGKQVESYAGIPFIDLKTKPGTNTDVVQTDGTKGTTSLYVARLAMDGLHAVSLAGTSPVQTWLPDFSTAGAVKKGEVEMNAAIALKASKAAGVFRNIKVK